MKKYIRFWYFAILLISFLPFVGVFATPLLPHTHDGAVHLARIAAYYKALTDGQFPVRWAGDLNFGYGMPLFNFMYQLPYLLASFFVAMHLGLVLSFKITLVLSFLLSGLFMFAFANAFFQDERKAFLVTIFYQFAPFRFVELLIRGSFGEVYTYTFFPLILYGVWQLAKERSYKNFFITVLALALLVLSHNALSLVFFILVVAFVLFFIHEKKALISIGAALCFGLMLSAYYWVPAIFEHKYTYGDLLMQNLYKQYFPPLQNFFIPNFFNAERFLIGGVSVQIGLFHTVAIFLAMWVIFKKAAGKLTRKLYLFGLIVSLVTFFIMLPISRFLWEHVTLLRQFQFPWRILGVIAFTTSLFSSSYLFFQVFQKRIVYYTLIFLVILSTAFYWRGLLGWDAINENYYWNFPKNTTYFGETDVIWSEGPAKAYPKERVSFIEGSGKITYLTRKSNQHVFNVIATSSGKIVDRTEYFPGWRAYVNGKQVSIEFQNQDYRGLLTFPVPAGANTVIVKFGETPIRFVADVLSLIGIMSLLVVAFLKRKLFV